MNEEQGMLEPGAFIDFEFNKESIIYLLNVIIRRISLKDECTYLIKDEKVYAEFEQYLWSKDTIVRVKIQMEEIEL